VGDQIRQILLEQADLALAGLQSGASKKAVHEARKACKRSRAAVALVSRGLGRRQSRETDRAFRDAARHIGPVRDADVMREHMTSLGGTSAEVEVRSDRDLLGQRAVSALLVARRVVERLDLSNVDLHVAVDGLVRSATSARARLRDVRRDRSAEAFHEWRKVVKRHGYHLELMGPVAPDILGAVLTGLDVLQEQLGNHHDLAVLAEQGTELTPAVRAEMAQRVERLEREALALGAWWFAARPAVMRRFLEAREAMLRA
jgi:CHAD domain-containing protein